MGFFDWWKSKPAPKKTVEGHLRSLDQRKAPQKQQAREQEGAATETPVVASQPQAVKKSGFLACPHASEKASALATRGTHVFLVPLSATKVQIRKAVEQEERVQVVRVNILRGEGKPVRRGRQFGRRPRWKRALVTLKPGQHLKLQTTI